MLAVPKYAYAVEGFQAVQRAGMRQAKLHRRTNCSCDVIFAISPEWSCRNARDVLQLVVLKYIPYIVMINM